MKINIDETSTLIQSEILELENRKVGDLVTMDSRIAKLFIQYKIDYCCGGKKTLKEACGHRGINMEVIRNSIREIIESSPINVPDINRWDLDVLVDYIIRKHHNYIRHTLPMILELGDKVARVHGNLHPELIEIQKHIKELGSELSDHIDKEEQILFPLIRSFATTSLIGNSKGMFHGRAYQIIERMEFEHDTAAVHLNRINQLSQSYTTPLGACTSYQVLYSMLKEFEEDVHLHVHLENNILFPKAIQQERMRNTMNLKLN